MEENQNLTPEQETDVQDQNDGFLDGWDEDATEGAADQPNAEVEGQEPSEESGEAEGEEEKEGAEEADRAEDKSAENAKGQENTQGPMWEVNHLGQHKTLRAQDITPELLQKGLDYDRVSQKYDATKPVMSVISELARMANMTVTDYVQSVRMEAKKAQGMGEDEAKRAIDLENRERVVAERESSDAREAAERKAGEDKIQQDIAEFAKGFPEVYEKAKNDTKVIPDSVWADVNAGMSLSTAYARHVVAQAGESVKKAEELATAAEQGRKNAARATGSMQSAGSNDKNNDPFLEGWGD